MGRGQNRDQHMSNRLPADTRFWGYVDITGEEVCWPWIGARDRPNGYGRFSIKRSRAILAHRFAWILSNGPIPDGLCVLHRCDNPPCVNPAHLFLGTQADNNVDCVRKGRNAKGERHGWHTKPDSFARWRGEGNPNAKLTISAVRAIRADQRAERIIAREYGVSKSLIGAVRRREIWREVEQETGAPS